MKKLYRLLIVASAALLGGCLDNGSTAAPPTDLTVTAGDGRVMVEWTPTPGVDYWLFTAAAPNLTAFNWTGLPYAHAYLSVRSPYYVCGLFSDLPYYFAMNGRISGGPGGDSSNTVSATPYDASAFWVAPVPPANGIPATSNIYGTGYVGLETCSNSAVSASGAFTVVGQGGAIYVSSDGKTWAPPANPPPGFATDLYAVTGYAANQNYPTNPALRWVAVGAGGASVFSLDGSTWAVGNPAGSNSTSNPTNETLRSIAHNAGTYIAVGDAPAGGSGTILSSTDGISWTSHASGTPNNLNGVTRGSVYVAVGDNGTVLTSIDGNSWFARIPTPDITAVRLRAVTSNGPIYVAVGDGGTVVTSLDAGVTWTARTLAGATDLVGVAAEYKLVANALADPALGYVSIAQFVAVDSTGNAFTSPNGVIWSSSTGTGISTNSLISSGFGYVAAGNNGSTAYAF